MAEPLSTPVEEAVADMWRELLDVDAVFADDMFLALGGNSLLATMLANWLDDGFGVRPSIQKMFNLNLRELAALCETHGLRASLPR